MQWFSLLHDLQTKAISCCLHLPRLPQHELVITVLTPNQRYAKIHVSFTTFFFLSFLWFHIYFCKVCAFAYEELLPTHLINFLCSSSRVHPGNNPHFQFFLFDTLIAHVHDPAFINAYVDVQEEAHFPDVHRHPKLNLRCENWHQISRLRYNFLYHLLAFCCQLLCLHLLRHFYLMRHMLSYSLLKKFILLPAWNATPQQRDGHT